MRGRIGFLVGLAVGYVLGAKAGQERYQQIVEATRSLRVNPGVQRLTGEVNQTVSVGKDRVAETAAARADQAREAVAAKADRAKEAVTSKAGEVYGTVGVGKGRIGEAVGHEVGQVVDAAPTQVGKAGEAASEVKEAVASVRKQPEDRSHAGATAGPPPGPDIDDRPPWEQTGQEGEFRRGTRSDDY